MSMKRLHCTSADRLIYIAFPIEWRQNGDRVPESHFSTAIMLIFFNKIGYYINISAKVIIQRIKVFVLKRFRLSDIYSHYIFYTILGSTGMAHSVRRGIQGQLTPALLWVRAECSESECVTLRLPRMIIYMQYYTLYRKTSTGWM